MLLSACRKPQAVTQANLNSNTPAIAPFPEAYHQDAGETVPKGQTKFFKGSIGSSLGLQMKLTRDGEQASGNYFYQKVGTRIELKGTVDKAGNLSLDEYDSAGRQTGIFKGVWKTDNEDGLDSIAGNWSKPSGEKKTAFSLHEEPIQLSGGAEIVAKTIKENNKKENYQIYAEYPQVSGALDPRFEKFNQQARALAMAKVSEFKTGMAHQAEDAPATADQPATLGSDINVGYTIAMAKDDLISIEFEIGGYSQGAAHPNSYTDVLNYDVKAGKALKLADLFKPASKYLQAISTYCIKDLKRQAKSSKDALLSDDTIQSGAAAETKNFKSWTISKQGLNLTFDAYQVGPYAAGRQSVLIPYSALKDLLNPDGPLVQFVK